MLIGKFLGVTIYRSHCVTVTHFETRKNNGISKSLNIKDILNVFDMQKKVLFINARFSINL